MVGMDATLEVCIVPLSTLHQLLNELRGTGLTVEQHSLVTEIVALCLLATHPAPAMNEPEPPLSGAERTRRWRDRKKEGVTDVTSRDVTVTEGSMDGVKALGFMPREAISSQELKSISSIETNNSIGTPVTTVTPVTSRGSRLPELWSPTQPLLDWALDQLDLERTKVEFETGAFRDFWHSKPGKAGTKLDWGMTWKNWMREVKRREDSRLTRKVKEQKPYYFGPV